jgi:hypothetical protein
MFPIPSTLVSFLVALLWSGLAVAGSTISGPQPGEKVPGPFKVLNITGPEAGQTSCQYCNHGTRPVVAIFTKAITPQVAQLLKNIDSATAMQESTGLGSFVVVCSDVPGMDQQLRAAASQLGLQKTILTLYKAGGPEKYRLAPEADVTVLLYKHLTVKANYAFKDAELTETAINAILTDLAKMLSEN